MIEIDQLAQAISNLNARLNELANRKTITESWVAPTLAGTWANSGGAYQVAGYWKDPWGTVHLRGRITGGAGTIFTLPAKYRPEATSSFSTLTGAVVDVTSAGVVSLVSGSTPVVLDVITFRAFA